MTEKAVKSLEAGLASAEMRRQIDDLMTQAFESTRRNGDEAIRRLIQTTGGELSDAVRRAIQTAEPELKDLRYRVDRYEAYQAWALRKSEYDECKRGGQKSYCADPGPSPQ